MNFQSILFKKAEDSKKGKKAKVPDFFKDLNLDQIVETVTSWKQEYELKSFFYVPLRDVDSIKYRHEVMQEIENNKELLNTINAFANNMRTMRKYLAQADDLYYKYQKERWFLDAVEIYCNAIIILDENLSSMSLHSRGFLGFQMYLSSYVNSPQFKVLYAHVKKLKDDLSKIKYTIFIKGNSVTVRKYNGEADYSKEVEKTFEKFKQKKVKNYTVKFLDSTDMNHVEARILDMVAQLYENIFSDLDEFYNQNKNYMDKIIATYDREIQFYIAYLDYIAPLKKKGLNFCYPEISPENKEIYDYESFDLALAYKLSISNHSSVVPNDFYLKDRERIIVVTGPNQGGKTTFARSFGQLHYLASLGCPVPGKKAKLFLFDKIFTHFEKEEDVTNLRSKLEDEIIRIHDILRQATPNSIIIINEIFSSTTLQDAIFLSKKIMEKLIELDLLSVWVTFIDELTTLNEKIVSMVSTVLLEDPTVRTYKIIRKPADGLSYAISIAEKYRLTYDYLKERIKDESLSNVQRP